MAEIKAVDVMHKIYNTQLLTCLKAIKQRVGLLIYFNTERLKKGKKRLII
ncbi:MAG: hypothetical protein HY758_05425 [Nitrospirae bacterium]|nr:hypothetical protein [Nitrospirota bacterium]